MLKASLVCSTLACLVLSSCVVRVAPHPHAPQDVVVTEAPPAERVEVIGLAPSADHVWIRGYWTWTGRWTWVNGHWETRRHGHEWVPGHWTNRGHGYVWEPGHWRRL